MIKAGRGKEKAERTLQLLKDFNAQKDKESRSKKRGEKKGKEKLWRSAENREEDEEDEDDYNQAEGENDTSEGTKDIEDEDMTSEDGDNMEFIEKIVGHGMDQKIGKQLKVQWDNGSIEWHWYGDVVKDEFFMVKDYVMKHGLEKKGVEATSEREEKHLGQNLG